MTHHIVYYSGGIASWAEAKLTTERYGTQNTTLVFTDTKIEDPDLYRFLHQTAEKLGVPLIKLADGRNIWQVFKDKRFLGNSRTAPCSRILKSNVSDQWLADNYPDPSSAVLHFGFTWDERDRLARVKTRVHPYPVESLLAQHQIPHDDLFTWLERDDIQRPRLYEYGFTHNNCGGGCVRAGKAHFAHLLRTLPSVYHEWERNEAEVRQHIGADVTILKDETLAALRERLERQPALFNHCDITSDVGACGCFLTPDAEDAA